MEIRILIHHLNITTCLNLFEFKIFLLLFPIYNPNNLSFFSQNNDAGLSKDVSNALLSSSLCHNMCCSRNRRCDPEYGKAEERIEPGFPICWERTLITKLSHKVVGRLDSYSSFSKESCAHATSLLMENIKNFNN